MKLQVRHLLIVVLLLSFGSLGWLMYRQHRELAACCSEATLRDDPAHPGAAHDWVDTRLYFGLGPADAPEKGTSDAAWREFLDTEVTPRFPAGLSVLDVYGQWQGKNDATPKRVRTKMVAIDYEDTRDNRSRIEAIRAAWKKRTGDQSVLQVTQPADVSF